MAIIYSYPLNDDIKPLDELVGTTEKNINGQLKTVTRNFLLQDLAEFFIVDGGIQKTIILTTEGDSGLSTLDQVTGILNIPQYAGLQNLQQVTDLGNITSNSMRVELANNYSQINVSNIGTENTTLSTYAYLINDGSISIKSGAVESNIKNTSVINSGVILEFPNKVSGSYTIATTSDVIAQNLQQVTDVGATTTNPITANSFIKIGGTGANILLDNGSTVALSSIGGNTNLSTSQTSTNFTINSDTGTDASVPLGDGTLAGATLNNYTTTEKNKLAAITGTNTGDQNLQQVTDLGASTTNPITANSFVKSGGTSSQILAADGSVITPGTNITITGGQISSVGGSGGGGSSVNYYLNGGTSQGTFGGTTYYEFSKTAVIGTGADFSRGSNGYIASFITDIADPSLLLIPAGNWNLEFFFNSSSAGGSPSFYTELYKYDGTTFTLIASNSATPEGITNGTSIDAYFTALAVPETVLTVNDRLAIRVFVNASSKTITLHTQNGHLCEVITTFTAGLTALNGLQAQVQNFSTGTTGTDFAIVSSGSTHTFNLPSASAITRGVVTTGTQTFAGQKTFQSTPIAPTPAAFNDSALLATTEYVDRQIGLGGPAYNILIGGGTGMGNITTETTGTSGGVSYTQNGRNVMINNGATAITVAATVASTPTDFIASYTKIGTATITFTFTGTGFVFVTPNGAVLSGNAGSTALLTKNGSTVYLLINNIF
jgi:hypothetical protein